MDSAIRRSPHLRSLADVGPLRSPVAIAGFSGGQGSAAASTIAFLADAWNAELIAELDPDEFYDFTVARPIVRLDEGRRTIEWPRVRIYAVRLADAVCDAVLIEAREPNFHWRRFNDALIEVVRQLGVQSVAVIAALAGAAPHTRPLPVLVAGDTDDHMQRLGVPVQSPRYAGPADAGMAFAVRCREQGLSVCSILAVTPFYLQMDPSPHAVHALATMAGRLVGRAPELSPLERAIAEANEQVARVVEQSRDMAFLVANLERQLAESVPGESPSSSLVAAEVLADVEALLRHPGDAGGPSQGRHLASG